MQDEDWKEFVEALVDATRCLGNAWQVLDGSAPSSRLRAGMD